MNQASKHSIGWYLMNKKAIAALAATLGLAAGIGGSALTYSLTEGGSSDSGDTAAVTEAITSYVTALSDANTKVIGEMSCGQLEEDFKAAKEESIAAQLKESTKERGRAKVDEVRNVSIEDGKALAAAMVTYEKDGKSQANLTTYGLMESESSWKVCWNVNVKTVNFTEK